MPGMDGYQIICCIVAHSPKKFLIIHREHIKPAFLAGNDDILDIFLNWDQRTSFNVIISVIFNEMFYCLSSKGTALNFIKYYQRFSFNEIDLELQLKLLNIPSTSHFFVLINIRKIANCLITFWYKIANCLMALCHKIANLSSGRVIVFVLYMLSQQANMLKRKIMVSE